LSNFNRQSSEERNAEKRIERERRNLNIAIVVTAVISIIINIAIIKYWYDKRKKLICFVLIY